MPTVAITHAWIDLFQLQKKKYNAKKKIWLQEIKKRTGNFFLTTHIKMRCRFFLKSFLNKKRKTNNKKKQVILLGMKEKEVFFRFFGEKDGSLGFQQVFWIWMGEGNTKNGERGENFWGGVPIMKLAFVLGCM